MQPNPYWSELLIDKSADESIAVRDIADFDHAVIYLVGNGTTSSGVITIAESHDVGFTGTWSALTTVNASDLTGSISIAVHLQVAAYKALQVRISTAIGGGGTISAWLGAH